MTEPKNEEPKKERRTLKQAVEAMQKEVELINADIAAAEQKLEALRDSKKRIEALVEDFTD